MLERFDDPDPVRPTSAHLERAVAGGRRRQRRRRGGFALGAAAVVAVVAVGTTVLTAADEERVATVDEPAVPSDYCGLLAYELPPLERWEGVDVAVYLEPGAFADQIALVGDQLEDDSDVERLDFIDQEAAFEEFRELFADTPGMIESVTPDILPASYRLVLAEGVEPSTVRDRYGNEPGVNEVVLASEQTLGRVLDALVGEWLVMPRPTESSYVEVRGAIPRDTSAELLDAVEASAPDALQRHVAVVVDAATAVVEEDMRRSEEDTAADAVERWDAAQLVAEDARTRCGLEAHDPMDVDTLPVPEDFRGI